MSTSECPYGVQCIDGMCTSFLDAGTTSSDGAARDASVTPDALVRDGTLPDEGVGRQDAGPADAGRAPPPDAGVRSSYTLTVVTHEASPYSGIALVTSSPAGISCPTTCTQTYPAGTVVTLSTGRYAAFACPWTSPASCSASTAPCAITMDADKTAELYFQMALGSPCP